VVKYHPNKKVSKIFHYGINHEETVFMQTKKLIWVHLYLQGGHSFKRENEMSIAPATGKDSLKSRKRRSN
jgi:hypothetical protein